MNNYGSRWSQRIQWTTFRDDGGLFAIALVLSRTRGRRFNWSVVDTPAQRWIAKGKKIAFRFSCTESWLRFATPEWVQKAGAKGYNFKPGELDENGPYWEPEYDDPVFLEKLDHFLAAAAARYDGNPEVHSLMWDPSVFGGKGILTGAARRNGRSARSSNTSICI